MKEIIIRDEQFKWLLDYAKNHNLTIEQSLDKLISNNKIIY